jgi:hypothetical protein
MRYIVGSNGNSRNWISSAVVQLGGILTVVHLFLYITEAQLFGDRIRPVSRRKMAGRKSCSNHLDFCLHYFDNCFSDYAHPSRCSPPSFYCRMGPIPSPKRCIILILDTGLRTKSEKRMTPAPPYCLDYKSYNSVAEIAATARREL